MTEAEWLACVSPHAMLTAVGSNISDRKLRLLSSRIADMGLQKPSPTEQQLLAADPDTRDSWKALTLAERLIEDLERFADSHVSAKRLRRSLQQLTSLHSHRYRSWHGHVSFVRSIIAAAIESPPQFATLLFPLREDIKQVPLAQAVDLLQELLGNPFRSVDWEKRWRTADTVGLARGIYEDRAFHRMPLLADALMDAGCADEQILAHCCSPGPHVRGCWVVDLVLDKH
jgi:hypothetical protein